jgi:molybdopterin-guanine dinucleotide biosynthesis protein A
LLRSVEKEITNLPPRFGSSAVTPIEGFVLAGGASTRMGRDKANITFGRETLARRAAGVLGAFAKSVRVVGGAADGLESVRDVAGVGGAGTRASLIGLHSAYFHGRTEWVAVLACDLPFVTSEFFLRLIEIAEREGGGADAVVPVQPDGKPQPLAALYRRTACLSLAQEMLSENNFRLTELLDRISTRLAGPESYSDLRDAGRLFFNVNSPDDLDEAIEMLGD